MTERKAFPTEDDIIDHAAQVIDEWLDTIEDERALAMRLYKLFRSYL